MKRFLMLSLAGYGLRRGLLPRHGTSDDAGRGRLPGLHQFDGVAGRELAERLFVGVQILPAIVRAADWFRQSPKLQLLEIISEVQEWLVPAFSRIWFPLASTWSVQCLADDGA